jgi:NHL repeat
VRAMSFGNWGLSCRHQVGVFAMLLLGILLHGPVVPGAVAAPPTVWDACDAGEPPGMRCDTPRGVAADPRNGHVFVVDQDESFGSRILEYTALGEFVKTWGWDVVASGPGNQSTSPEPPQFEICRPGNGDVCKEGVPGSGDGQFEAALGIAVDSAGSIYVTDFLNNRVQKFDRDGSFVLMFGGKVNKTKVDSGTATVEEESLCPVDPGDECQRGTPGSGPGQFGSWGIGDVIAVDSSDNVYVGDQGTVQRFTSSGSFQDQCPVSGTVQSLDVDSAGSLYVTYESQQDIRKLSPVPACAESMRFEIPEPDEVTDPSATAVAVDAAGHVYAFSDKPTGNGFVPLDRVFEFDASGNVVTSWGKNEFTASSTGIAANRCAGSPPPGNVYVTNLASEASGKAFVRAYGSDPVGCSKAATLPADPVGEKSATLRGTVNPKGGGVTECFFEYGATTTYGETVPCAQSPGSITGSEPVPVHANTTGLDAGTIYHFRLVAVVEGETEAGIDVAFKTLGPPVISDLHVEAVTDTEATLKARVNPEGFATSCRVDYGPTAEYGQSSSPVPAGPDGDTDERAVTIVLEGLEPGATYHWRMVCTNESGTTPSADRDFTTYLPPEVGACPNDALRTGVSAKLPDCRAYEMVSPIEKNGADIANGLPGVGKDVLSPGDPGGYIQVSPDGNRLTYTSRFPAFAEPQNSFVFNQYLGSRKERGSPGEGWASEAIHPPYEGRAIGKIVFGVFREFMAFSPDLCNAWLVDYQTPPLMPDAQEEAANLYRRDNCAPGKGSLETLTDAPAPTGEAGSQYVGRFSMQGTSDDSRHAVFLAAWNLTPDAAPGDTDTQIYDRHEGENHVVSVLPNGSPGDPNPGDGMGFADPSRAVVGSSWIGRLDNAVSADGSHVYWTSGVTSTTTNEGRIFLRIHPEQGVVAGECSEPGKACTIPVSADLTTPPPFTRDAYFWAAAADGSKALYSEEKDPNEKDLYLFDLATKESNLLATGVRGVVETSEDLWRIYFVSEAALPGSRPNSEGEEAQAGEPNLYLAEDGGIAFIGTLLEGDVGEAEPDAESETLAYNLATRGTYLRASRTTPGGERLVFQSRAPLTGFDSADAAGGEAAVEVFTYEAGSDQLHCVSCNPSGARPLTREMSQPYNPPYVDQFLPSVPAAAWIPTWEHPLHDSRVVSDDGRRIFFNSNDALLPRDTNGTQDVYEWERPGTGSCKETSGTYFAENGGCLYLISTGESSFESEFWDASADGEDVFFTTAASILPQDPGSVDLYDARVNGGFPAPRAQTECEGEACQSPPPAPGYSDGGTATYSGPGDVREGKKPRRCRKGKRRVRRAGRVRCVKRRSASKHRTSKQRAGRNGRAGR